MLNPQKFTDDSQRPVETACLRVLNCGLRPLTSAPQWGFSADLGLSGRRSSPSADSQWQSRLTTLPPLCFLSDRLEGLAEWPDQISEGLWGGYNALANGLVFWKKKNSSEYSTKCYFMPPATQSPFTGSIPLLFFLISWKAQLTLAIVV